MREIIEVLFQAVVVGCAPVIVGIAGKLVNAKVSEITEKMQDNKAAEKIRETQEFVMQIVEETTQSYVDNMKKKSVFDEEAQKTAFQKSFNKAKVMVTAEVRELVQERYSDFDKWLETQIESAIGRSKCLL